MNNSFTILQIEDDENDIHFLRLAMNQACASVSLQTAVDGEQAIGYLSGSGPYADRQAYPLPALILLDLRMPKIPGLHLLKWIRQQPVFQTLPVVILTSSDADSDIETAYRLAVNSYFVKPVNASDLLKIVQYILARWLQIPTMTQPDEATRFLKHSPVAR
jgi:CheY-like chemotaxis protein